jgi:orotidine-5'-phosphate decarboxylase
MISENKIIVALDTQEKEKFSFLLSSIEGKKVWVKIGMECFYALGPSAIEEAKKKGFKVFLDLKLHDIPNTVAKSLKALSGLSFDMINVHAAGGSEMMKRASEIVHGMQDRPLLIAVTQLTSTSQEMMNKEQKISGDIIESVSHYAKLAQVCGLDGVVSSPLETPAIKLICGSKFITVTPGIRPLNTSTGDQVRVTTPNDAIKLGTDFMVIGRPITEAPSPREALEEILKG